MAKKAKRTGAGKKTNRKAGRPNRALRTAKRSAKKAARRSAKQAQPNRATKPPSRPAGRKGAAATARARKTAARKPVATKKRAAPKAAAPRKAAVKASPARRPPTLDRARRTVTEAETHGVPSSLNLDRKGSAARTGRAELKEKLHEHTSTSPALTGGDVDADWESAEAVGDEAPGGDNPTPDQDVVDEIGKSLGVEYDDDEELLGGDEIRARDKKRWELDPASSDDFDDRD